MVLRIWTYWTRIDRSSTPVNYFGNLTLVLNGVAGRNSSSYYSIIIVGYVSSVCHPVLIGRFSGDDEAKGKRWYYEVPR